MSDFKKLYYAVINNDYNLLYKLIEDYKINVNIKNIYNKTVLYYANDERIVDLLLNNGAIVDIYLLLFLYDNNKRNIILYILTNEDRVVYEDDLNNFFRECMKREDIQFCEILIDYGVDVNEMYNDICGIPLLIACSTKNIELVKLLIDHGADVNKKYNYDENVLSYVMSDEYYHVAKFLIENNAEIDITDFNENTPLTTACENKNSLNVVKLLLDNGANINHKNSDDETGLIIACINNNYNVAKLLINYGANLNDDDESNLTALLASCKNNSIDEIIILLILSGSDINKLDDNGDSAFIIACKNNNFRIMKILIAAGCYYDINDNCVKQNISFINNYLNSNEYVEYYYKLNIDKSSSIFSNIVLLSDDYLRFR